MEQALKVRFVGSGAKAKHPPNPQYPNGIDVDFAPRTNERACKVPLPYPANGIGAYVIECPVCGVRVSCTTAGRVDDPRSARVPCNLAPGNH